MASPAPHGSRLAWAAANSLEFALAGMLVAICAIVFAGIFFRYFLHIGLGWTEELARFLQIWMTFVGATVGVKRWAHFQLALAQRWVPADFIRYLRMLAIAAVMVLAAILVKYGTDITRVTWNQSSPMLGWPIGYLYLIAPVSGVLMLGFCMRHFAAALKER